MGRPKGIYTTIGWWLQIWLIFSALSGQNRLNWLSHQLGPLGCRFWQIQGATNCCMTWVLPSLRIPWPCCLLASKRKKQLCRAWSKRARLRLVPRLWWNLVASPISVSRQMVQMPWWPWLLIVAWKIFVGVRPELKPQQKDHCFREILRRWPDSMDILAAKWCVKKRFVLWPGELCKLQCCFHILRHACFILHIFHHISTVALLLSHGTKHKQNRTIGMLVWIKL